MHLAPPLCISNRVLLAVPDCQCGRPDMTFAVDWALNNNYLSICQCGHVKGDKKKKKEKKEKRA